MRFLVAALVVVVGIAAFVYGGADDSPGLQLIGAVLVVVAVLGYVRVIRQSRAG